MVIIPGLNECRRICRLPGNRNFGPPGNGDAERKLVVMTVDVFDIIGLIDLERSSQEECAGRMNAPLNRQKARKS